MVGGFLSFLRQNFRIHCFQGGNKGLRLFRRNEYLIILVVAYGEAAQGQGGGTEDIVRGPDGGDGSSPRSSGRGSESAPAARHPPSPSSRQPPTPCITPPRAVMQGVFVEAKRLLTNADKVVGICRQVGPHLSPAATRRGHPFFFDSHCGLSVKN